MKIPITIAKGDGIGPEIMAATLHILEEAGAPLSYTEIEIGEKAYAKGFLTGIDPKTWDLIRSSRAFLKAPITTPEGGGFKSLNVTVRSCLGLYANIRPCSSYAPFITTKHPVMDLVIVRENEEDLYCGIEYQQTPDVTESIKLISRAGSEKIIRYAFEYARHHGRKKVSCFTKHNIMKISDGLFSKTFFEIAQEYEDIASEHWIIDIGSAKLADSPEDFDVIVMPNLYGDILSDVAAQISGSVGLAGSANIGDHGAMFEAIHGSAVKRANQNIANPSGLLHGAILMLHYLGENACAARIHNAWLKTIESGFHTYDIFTEGLSKKCLGTKEFGLAVAGFLGKTPETLKPVSYNDKSKIFPLHHFKPTNPKRELVGSDFFVYARATVQDVVNKVKDLHVADLRAHFVSNRGAIVWPEGQEETFCVEQWRIRFMHKKPGTPVSQNDLVLLHKEILSLGFDLIKTENLYTFDGTAGYSSSDIFRKNLN